MILNLVGQYLNLVYALTQFSSAFFLSSLRFLIWFVSMFLVLQMKWYRRRVMLHSP